MSVPSFMLPTNFRNDKNIKRMIKEFDVQGYGIAVYLLETLAETDNHMYPYRDIDLLADEMRISTAKIETVIKRYNIFEIIETTDGDMFISSKLNRWLEPYYAGKEQRQLAGKISAQKRKQKQLKQLLELSQIDSIQRPLNDRSTINELINKLINQSNIDENNEEEKEKWREFAEQQIKKMMETDKLEELALAYRDNQVPI
ncbi:Lin1244/Lin1753 domain-containing protein [Aliarcobacter cryaerophilus]|uniref:Lin1244/Lin1753 domain-containing protein n=1 Tax=Aliarcobacter cryaerophilus TaxID=28198 RepID=UPI000833D138|nr:Lin1244/Lin1753 domain-containing protein [Aliarcobacter cryaerophilus]